MIQIDFIIKALKDPTTIHYSLSDVRLPPLREKYELYRTTLFSHFSTRDSLNFEAIYSTLFTIFLNKKNFIDLGPFS